MILSPFLNSLDFSSFLFVHSSLFPPTAPSALQHWKDVSSLAKDFIDKTLVLDPSERLGAVQASKHPWLMQNAAHASSRNLHRTVSQNLLQRQSQRANSTKSSKSTRSNKSNRSGHSLRSDRRRVQPEEIDELHKDPEVQADLASLGSHHSSGRT